MAFAINDDYANWAKFKTIAIDTRNATGGANVSANQANFPVLIRLTSTNASDIFATSSFSSTGIDIRFASGATHLSYQRERWDGTNKLAEFWVLVPLIKGNDTTKIQILWNNSGAADSSNSSGMSPVFATANNYQAVWHMNGSTTTTDEIDATSNGFTATQQNSPTAQSTGAIGYSRQLNGTSQGFIAGIPSKGQDLKSVRFFGVIGYAVGVNGVILKTLDSGVTWVSQTSGTTQTLNSIFCLDSSNCAATGGNGTLIITTNGGTSWAVPTGAGGQGTGSGITQQWNSVYVIGSFASGTAYVAGFGTGTSSVSPNGNSTVRKATISGGSWTWAATAGALATNYTARVIVCSDANNCVVGAGDDANPRVNATTNGGTSWGTNNTPSSFTNAVTSMALIGTVASGTLYIAGGPTNGSTANTANALQKGTITNGVITWGSAITSGLTNIGLNSISCTDATHCIAVGNVNGSVPAITATTNGTSWTAYTNSNGLTYQNMNGIYCLSTTNCFAVGAGGTTLKTANGTSWSALTGNNALNFQPRGNYTISAWAKWSGTNGGDAAAHVIVQKNARQYYLKTQTTNKWVVGEYAGNAAREAATTTNVDTSWHYVVGVRNGNTSDSVYVDGNFTGNLSGAFTTSTASPDLQDQTTGLGIGRASESTTQFWNGRIDEVVLSNATRSRNWIRLNYETQKSGATAVAFEMDSLKLSQTSLNYSWGSTITPDTIKVYGVATTLSISGPGVTDSASFRTATGLIFNRATGVISGTASVVLSSSDYTITATNAAGSLSANLNITVNATAPSNLVYSSTSYKFGVGLASTTVTPTVSSGGQTVTYSVDPPLPDGLVINTSTGVISGTPTTGTVSTSYTVTADNGVGSTTRSLTIAVLNPITSFSYLTKALALPRNQAMTPDSPSVDGTVPFGPVTFSVSKTLPTGLTFDTLSGKVSGTPTTAQAESTFIVTAKNGITSFNKVDTLHIRVVVPPSSLAYSTSIINVEQNDPVSTITPTVNGGNGIVTYSISPDLTANTGLGFNASTGAISGTATTISATTAYLVTATNLAGSDTETVTITVLGTEDYAAWSNYRDITLNTGATAANTGASLAGFPVLVRLNKSHRVIFQQAGSGGASLRFANATGVHLPYQIERWSTTANDTSAAIWVALDNVNSGSTSGGLTSFRMHWGNLSATDRSNGNKVFPTSRNFRGVWHLGDVSGTSLRPNAVAGGPSAKPNNFPGGYVVKTGVIGMADTLRGGSGAAFTGDFFRIADTTSSDTTYYSDFSTGMTFSVWSYFNPTGTQAYSRWMELAGGTATSNPPGQIGFGRHVSTSRLRGEAANSGGTSIGTDTTTTSPLAVGAWKYVTLTIGTGSTPSVKFYTDGALQASNPAAFTAAVPVMNRRRAFIGKSAWSDSCFKGMLDEAVLSNVARDSNWIKLSYKNQKSNVTPVFDVVYPMSSIVAGRGTAIAIDSPTMAGTATRFGISGPSVTDSITFRTQTGLVFSALTGKISGTPTSTRSATTYTVTAYGDSAWSANTTVSLTVNGFTYANKTATFGKNVAITADTISAASKVGTFTGYSISPALPAGLTFDSTTGSISGKPVVSATAANYIITGTYAGGMARDTVNITVNGFTYSAPSPTYGKNVAITNNTPTVNVGTLSGNYSVSPSLPAGLTLNTTSGAISGTPTVVQTSAKYAVSHAFAAGGNAVDTVAIAINGFSYIVKPVVYGKNVTATNDTFVAGTIGTFTGYSISPSLPAGLSFNTSTGAVTGKPTVQSAATNYLVTGTFSGGTARDTLNLTVLGFAYATRPATYGKNVAITSNTLTAGRVGTFTNYSVNPPLPVGLVLDTATGAISGMAKEPSVSAAYVITGNGAAVSGVNDTLSIAVNGFAYAVKPAIYGKNVAITPDTLVGKVGTFTAYSISPTLPSGLSLNTSTGTISGTSTVSVASTNYILTGSYSGGTARDTLNLTLLGFSYAVNPAVYRVNSSIAPNITTDTGWSPTSFSGSLPPGLLLNDATGAVTGTPTAASVMTKYPITATNGIVTVRDTLTITINQALPEISYTTPVSYIRNVAVANSPVSTGGPITRYSVNPALPVGLALDTSTGVISGTPTVSIAAQNYRVIATGPGGADTAIMNIAVTDPPPHVSYSTPVIYLVGNPITPNTPVSTGGAINSFSISPSLPSGLALDTLTGAISGTPTSFSGPINYKVAATGPGGTDTAIIRLTTTSSSAVSYNSPVVYVKGIAIAPNVPNTLGGPFTHYTTTPAFPSGLQLNDSTGVISGIPGTPAASASYTIKAAGASDTVTTLVNITIQDTAPRVSYVRTSISAVSRMSIVPDTVLSTGGVVDSFTISPTLPSGLSLGKTSGLISGTPVTAAANVSYTITARGPGGTGTAVVSIVVADTAPAISYVRLGINGVKGVTIIPDSIVSVGGSVDSFVISPALPVGLTMSKSTGRISGTPSVISSLGVYTVTAAGPGGTGVTLLILGVADTAPAISYKRANISAVKGVVIVPDSVNSVGGVVDSFTVAPALPSGLSLGKTSGLISGTPSAVAVAANYTITARGPGGTGTVVVNITVQDTAPRIAYQTTPVTFGRNVSATPDSVISTGGTVTRYSVAPALPTGLLLDTSTGIISGIPTTLAGPANYTVTANGPGGTGTTVVNITVTDQTPVITYRQTTLVLVRDTSMAPDSSISTGGLVTRYSVSPSLPAGLFLDSLTGTVSGSPAVSVHPAVNYTVTATGPGGSATAQIRIAIYRKPANLSYTDDPVTYVLGVQIDPDNTASVTGVITHWSVSPALPSGMLLDTVTGALKGTPSGSQHFASNYTVTASNPAGSVSYTINITIVGPPSNLSYADDVPTYAVGLLIDPPNTPTIQGIVTFYTATPALPPGVILDQTTGYILGTPTAASPASDYTITGFNPGGFASTTINLGVIDLIEQ
jgi:hypothetical protein